MILYFLADVAENIATIDYARQIGLGYAFGSDKNAPFAKRGVLSNGPGGKAGVVISQNDNQIGLFPDRQTWAEHKGIANVWIGIENENRNPLDYIRHDWKGEDGEPLITESWPLISDSVVWPIPVARAYGDTLPHEIDFNGKEFVKGPVIKKFRRLAEIAILLVEHCDMEPAQLPENYLEICYEVISSAYLIGKQEYAMLNIVGFEPDEAFKMLRLVMDMPGLKQRQQKKTDSEPAA